MSLLLVVPVPLPDMPPPVVPVLPVMPPPVVLPVVPVLLPVVLPLVVLLPVVPVPVPVVLSVRLHPPSAMTSAAAPATIQTAFVFMRSIRKSPE